MPAKTRNSTAAEEKKAAPEAAAPKAAAPKAAAPKAAPSSPIEDKLNSLSAVVDALQAAVEELKVKTANHDRKFRKLRMF